MPKAMVTGMGVISALGLDCSENLRELRKGETGIRVPSHLDSRYASTHLFGEVDADNELLLRLSGQPASAGLSRTDLLAMRAFGEAVIQSGLSQTELSSPDTAFISASTVGGMCLTDELYSDAHLLSAGTDFLKAYSFGSHTLRLAEKYHIKGYTTTFNTACSSSANAIMLGARLIRAGKIKRAIVGGTDALAKFTINGFNSLQILSADACKPFDVTRTGLTLGEGAGYLVLEAEELCGDKIVFAEILGFGNANDAFHPSSLSEEATGVAEAIAGALSTSGLKGREIDYVNAHGTATPNNDSTELTGIRNTLGWIPPFSSTKSFTGHTLGAAGAIEAIYSIFSILYSEIYPSLNCLQPMLTFDVVPERKYRAGVPIRHVLSNSFGFGGNCTSLILGKIS
jgi:3-oxoacyl-(acyl-carrier-protein) synthase